MNSLSVSDANQSRRSSYLPDSNNKAMNMNMKLENLFNMWLPNRNEPLVVSYSEYFKLFKGQKLRIITLRDLTPDFKLNE
jgi:hypothetical protein